ncbi:MAG: RIP metalloprotease RseP [Gammaproteobacteria bacterium]|nr:RIP metalloprotease RseP [Gammaproteobacteria bacterium]
MTNIFISIIAILITILLVVGIHEFGHFFVARCLGIKVLRFSLGFGKILFSWHDKKGTQYALSAIPLGGYVKMLDEDEGHVPKDQVHLAFNRQPYYKKFLVVAAGPLSNFIFAIFIYWILFSVGFISIAPMIGKITPHSIAAQAGLQANQEILQVDSKHTPSWTSVVMELFFHAGDKNMLQLTTTKINGTQSYTLNLTEWKIDDLKPDPLSSLGIIPYEPHIPAIIAHIQEKSPAELANLLVGDKIVAVDKKSISDWQSLSKIISEQPNKTLLFTIQRNKKILEIPINIGSTHNLFYKNHGYLGISPTFEWPKNLLRTNQYPVFSALSHAFQNVETFTKLNFIILGKMITGKISLQSLGGPITIFDTAGTALNQGAISFLSFLAFLSISIGTINIIPIPGLDGGHLLFQTIEYISGKPLSTRAINLSYRLGMILLFVVMMQAIINDLLRL